MTDRVHSQAELEGTFRDFVDPDYGEGLEHEGEGLGWDTVAAGARIYERTSQAIARNGQAFYVLPYSRQTGEPASGPVKAWGPVVVSRNGNAQVPLIIPAGKLLRAHLLDSRGAEAPVQAFELLEQVELDAGQLGPVTVQARATRPGDQGNLMAGTLVGFLEEGARTVAAVCSSGNVLTDSGVADVFTAGDVGRYCRLTAFALPRRILSYGQASGGPGTVILEGDAIAPGNYSVQLLEWADLGVQLVQPEDFTNGRHAQLDAIGRESRIARGPGESDLDYAYRISSLPDVVSPNAIDRICARILSPLGVGYEIHETQLQLQGFILDRTPLDAGVTCKRGAAWDGSALLSLAAERRYFVVCVDASENAGSYGLPRDVLNAGINAYDVATGPGDGSAVGYTNALRTLYQALLDAHGYGVGFRIVPRRGYVPYSFLEVDVSVDLAAVTTNYVIAAGKAVRSFFQTCPPGYQAQPWQLQQAIEQGLTQAGLNPAVTLLSVSSMLAGARQQLVLGDFIVS